MASVAAIRVVSVVSRARSLHHRKGGQRQAGACTLQGQGGGEKVLTKLDLLDRTKHAPVRRNLVILGVILVLRHHRDRLRWRNLKDKREISCGKRENDSSD